MECMSPWQLIFDPSLHAVCSHVGSWSEGGELCAGVLQSIISNFLLGNPHLCLSGCSSNHWLSASIPDKKSEIARIKRLKICRCNHLHFQHHTHGLGIGDILPENIHQYWDWNKRIWNLHSNYHFPRSDIHSEGENDVTMQMQALIQKICMEGS